MSPDTWSLVGKEWRERRWVFAACCGWVLCCLVYAIAYDCTRRYRDPVASYYQVSSFYGVFGAVFLAMKTALGEATQRTLSFSLSLPVSRRRLAAVRLVASILALVVPILVGAILLTPLLSLGVLEQAAARVPGSYVSMPERPSMTGAEAVGMLWTATAISIASGTQLLVILSIIGARLKSEAQVGFCGAVVAFAWLMLAGIRSFFPGAHHWIGATVPVSLAINWGYGTENGSYTDLELVPPVWWPLGINVALQIVLAWWFTRRYGTRNLAHAISRPRLWLRRPALWSHIPIWLPNGLAALVWVNLRQSVSMALWGLVLALGITLLQTSGFQEEQTLRSQLPSSVWIVGVLWAAVVGIGVFAAELQPGLSRFWRSRPISVGAWFWCKFFIGMVAVIGVLDGFTIYFSWGTPIDFTSGLSLTYVACMPLLHGTIYAIAVLGICSLRRPILGGALAIGGFFVVTALISSIFGESFEVLSVYNAILGDEIEHGRIDLTAHHYPLVYGTLMVISVASAWLAYRAVRAPEKPALFGRREIVAT